MELDNPSLNQKSNKRHWADPVPLSPHEAASAIPFQLKTGTSPCKIPSLKTCFLSTSSNATILQFLMILPPLTLPYFSTFSSHIFPWNPHALAIKRLALPWPRKHGPLLPAPRPLAATRRWRAATLRAAAGARGTRATGWRRPSPAAGWGIWLIYGYSNYSMVILWTIYG